jgi:hypothetical protein
MRRFPKTQALRPNRSFVDFHAKSDEVACWIIGTIKARLHRKEVRVFEAQLRFRGSRLEPSEVGTAAARCTEAAVQTGPSGLCGIKSP